MGITDKIKGGVSKVVGGVKSIGSSVFSGANRGAAIAGGVAGAGVVVATRAWSVFQELFVIAAIIYLHLVDAINQQFTRNSVPFFMIYLVGSIVLGQFIYGYKGWIKGIRNFAIIWLAPIIVYWIVTQPFVRSFLPAKLTTYVAMAMLITPIWFWALFLEISNNPDKFGNLVKFLLVFYILIWVIVCVSAVSTGGGRSLLISSDYRAPVYQAFLELLKLIKGFIAAFLAGLKNAFSLLVTGAPAFVDDTVKEAVGQDYFTGQVEENKGEPLGVYLQDVQTADPEYHEGDTVVVWGNLVAKTFDKPINIYLACYAYATNMDGTETTYKASSVKPAKQPFVVSEYSEAPFECKFENPTLPVETTEIKVEATFNFETMSYMRTYFMRGENLLSKKKELKDNGKAYDNAGVLSSYGLNPSPTATYTNGPIAFGMGSTEPPIRIDPDSGISPYFGVTVENQWDNGIIKRINNLYILVPQPITIDLACGNDLFAAAPITPNHGEDGYNKYRLTRNEGGKVVDIEGSSSFRCMMNVGADALDDTPGPTIRTLKAYVDYIYALQERIGVTIKKVE